MTPFIVSSSWLNSNLQDPNLILLDASQPVNTEVKIEGTRTFDIKNVFSDTSSDLPNTFPDAKEFEKECQQLGINSSSKIVVYDSKGIFSSPRVWWMFKTMGYQNIAVLDGGLPEWVAQGHETVESKATQSERGNFKPYFNHKMITNCHFVESNIESQQSILIDARSAGRFNGTTPEPRAGLRGGHIPNSINLPYTEVLENGKFKSPTVLKKIFDNLNIKEQPLVFTCGSGITACIILLASEMANIKNEKSVYDGSWTEWAQLHKQ